MTERGGPATQAGIRYQNSVAALYLGDLLQMRAHSPRERVVEVRLEAPSDVDDVVVHFADHHREWIQAKISLSIGTDSWKKLWQDVSSQRFRAEFSHVDQLVLAIGEASDVALDLREIAERCSSSADAGEWQARLTKPQKALLGNVTESIESAQAGAVFSLFQCMRVDIIRERHFERDYGVARMPAANSDALRLISALRDLAGGEARTRGSFRAAPLRHQLLDTFKIELVEPTDWGVAAYRNVVRDTTVIQVPGTRAGGASCKLFIWPRASRKSDASDFEDEYGHVPQVLPASLVSLASFPDPTLSQCIVFGGPGFGKSTLLNAVANRLVSLTFVPAIVPLAALADSELEVADYLSQTLNAEFKVAIDWTRLAEQGLAVLLFDGLDEVVTDRRQVVIERIRRFISRYAQCPWMLTVRDLAAVPAGFEAARIELLPLDTMEVMKFVTAWNDGDEETARLFVDRICGYPDVERLVRIPLFLAILLATTRDNRQFVPQGRSDLIEAYLKTLFRPEEHKQTHRVSNPELLRRITEELSFRLLEEGSLGARERDVRRVLAVRATPTTSAETLFDDLLKCGILRRHSSVRLAFPFPIVQEYLAACYLLQEHSNEIASRAHRVAERPWAQVIQFALELLPNASREVLALLNKPDDAFHTTLRILGRCIVNGMKCDSAFKEEVGRKLAAAWPSASYATRGRIGQLLADGWIRPLLPDVRIRLFDKWLIHSGAGVILAELNDPLLVEEVLTHYLTAPEHLVFHEPLLATVGKLGERALELYIEKARRQGLNDDELWSLCFLIRNLNPELISQKRLHTLIADDELLPSVRLSVASLAGDASGAELWSLIEKALLTGNHVVWWPAFYALRVVTNPVNAALSLLRRNDIPGKAVEALIDHLKDIFPNVDERLLFYRSASQDQATALRYRLRLKVLAAGLKDVNAMEALVADLDTLPAETACATLQLLGVHRSRSMGTEVHSKLSRRTLAPEEVGRFAHALYLGAVYEIEQISVGGGILLPAPPHPAFDLLSSLIDQWSRRDDLGEESLLRTLIAASAMGNSPATRALQTFTARVIKGKGIGGLEDPLNNVVRSALDELRVRRLLLESSDAISFAERATSNALIGALYMVAAHGSHDALAWLINRHNTEPEDRTIVFALIEDLSARLGVPVTQVDSQLEVQESTMASSSLI